MTQSKENRRWVSRPLGSISMTRRRLLTTGATVASSGVIAGLLAACGGSSSKTPTTSSAAATTGTSNATAAATATTNASPTSGNAAASPTPATSSMKPGGSLVSMVVAEPTSMDIASGSGQHNYAVMSNVFENLLQWDDKTFQVIPCLAAKFDVSPDGLAYTFHLQQGVKFHDGTEMDADAVKFSYSRVLDPDNEYYKLGQPFPLMDFWYGSIDPKKTEVVDKYTVTLNLKNPFSPLESYLAWPAAAIVSPTAVQKYREKFRENPVGTGPFKFDSWVHNQQVTFSRYEDYWGEKAALDKLVFRPIVEEQTRITELLSGHIDFAYDLPPDNVAQVQSDSDFTFLQTPLGHVWFLVLNTKAGPTKDPKVRQAMAYAIDKQTIIKDILKGWAVPATGPVPSVVEYAYNKDVNGYAYDPEKAKQLLKDAGYENGFQTKFWVTQSGSGMQSPKAMAETIQAMLQEVGIQLQIQVFEWGAYLDQYAKGMPDDVSVAEMSWFTNDAQNIAKLTVTCDTVSPKGYNAGYYCNPKVGDLLDQFYGTLDKQKQADLMYQVQDIIATDEPNIYIDSQIATAALSKKFTGFSLHPSQLLRFWKTHLA